MKTNFKIAIIGGTGKAGKYLVQQLINRNISFKMLVRNPDNFSIENPLFEVIQGDVRDKATIISLITDCQAVISTLGMGIPPSEPTIFSQATSNIMEAMNEHKIRRYIVLSGLNVNTPLDNKSAKTQMATDWMYANYPKSTTDKQSEYDILAKSELDWTLVRLPLIEQTDNRGEMQVNLEDCLGDKISATNLADFLIEQLTDNQYIRQAPFVYNL